MQYPSHIVNNNGNLDDLISNNQLLNIFYKNFREEMLRMFKMLKETMEWTANKT